MNDQSEDKIAWAWYDNETLALYHVSFDDILAAMLTKYAKQMVK